MNDKKTVKMVAITVLIPEMEESVARDLSAKFGGLTKGLGYDALIKGEVMSAELPTGPCDDPNCKGCRAREGKGAPAGATLN